MTHIIAARPFYKLIIFLRFGKFCVTVPCKSCLNILIGKNIFHITNVKDMVIRINCLTDIRMDQKPAVFPEPQSWFPQLFS